MHGLHNFYKTSKVVSIINASVVFSIFLHKMLFIFNHRCLTYGNIYEYVPATEIDATAPDRVPCAYYRQAPVNGWQMPTGINRVSPIHLFNTNGCYPDWPINVKCPSEIGGNDPALI